MAKNQHKPTMFILAGANGSGKSTLYDKVIKPAVGAPFINADEIQKNELKNPDPQASYEAAQIAEKRRQDFMAKKISFVTETVFSHESKLKLVENAKKAGFQVALYHVGLRSADLNVKRVGLRVSKGGHPVPEEKVRARRERGAELIAEAARLSDRAFVYDNSNFNANPGLGIEFRKGQVVGVGENLPKWQRELYSKDLERFSQARLNPSAASYNIVNRMAKDITGVTSTVAQIPKNNITYQGPLVGESAQHFLQETNQKDYIAHSKNVIGDSHKLGGNMSIKYETSRKADVKTLPEVREPEPNQVAGQAVTRAVPINEAQDILNDNRLSAKVSFETDLKAAKKTGSTIDITRAEKRLKALSLAPSMIDKLKTEGVKNLQVETPAVATPAANATSIIKAGAKEYKNRGLGKTPSQNKDKSIGR